MAKKKKSGKSKVVKKKPVAKKAAQKKAKKASPEKKTETRGINNVFVTLHDAGGLLVGHWDKTARSVKDVIDRKPPVIEGHTEVSQETLARLIKLCGRKEIEATVSYSQGGYGPANAKEDVKVHLEKISVFHQGAESSEIEFWFTIVP